VSPDEQEDLLGLIEEVEELFEGGFGLTPGDPYFSSLSLILYL